jgi:hypothetical protein
MILTLQDSLPPGVVDGVPSTYARCLFRDKRYCGGMTTGTEVVLFE